MFGYRKTIKRILDIKIAFLLVMGLLPFMAVLSLLIFLVDGSPVFYKQERIGIKNKPFILYKFRTLANKNYTGFVFTKKDMSWLGRILRKTGFDELPQLLNVLRGEMSLVGPRPLPVEYLAIIKDHPRQTVRPGITGPVQVAGGNCIPWPERFSLDESYTKKIAFQIDAAILIKTLLNPLTNKKISSKPLVHPI